jgi:Ca2+-transporting ATPase
MTHIFRNREGKIIIAVKGALEGILRQTSMDEEGKRKVEVMTDGFAQKGYRVLGIGRAEWPLAQWPVAQEEFTYDFLGLIAFEDPPKENMKATIQRFRDAGIRIKMITGDHPGTALAVAANIGLDHGHPALTGDEVQALDSDALRVAVKDTAVFARMFPEAKLRVIEALRANGEVVAMTGDGVNDAPALKAAHIGIAMGTRGSEVAKGAAALILADDDLTHMVGAIAQGRKISDNLRKAIRYIVSIHIPIIGIVTIPLLLQWSFTSIFTPVHVIFLELIMGPTCSIIYENEPMEPGTMTRPPKSLGAGFLSFRQLSTSILQGLVITAACLGMGWWAIQEGSDGPTTRTFIFLTLLFSNIFLTLLNRSFRETIFRTIRYRNWMVPTISIVNILGILSFLYIPWVRDLFELRTLNPIHIAACAATALVGTCWIDLVKAIRKT